jgi:aminoglycoside phosphotransferase (APT) family kinase protein
MQLSDTARHWLASATGALAGELVARRLVGSTSSSIVLIEVPGVAASRSVLRVLDNTAWLTREPDLAEHEARALLEVRLAGLAGPEFVARGGAEAGFGAPVVLMSFVEGQVELAAADFDAWLSRLAAQLVRIHAHPARDFGWQHRTWLDRNSLQPPAWTRSPATWRRAIERVREPAPETTPVFLHRDYHPTNVLWRGGSVSGVVDWINACRGPAGVDVAHCRTNLCLLHGPDAAERFLEAYLSHGGGEHDAYWDIESILQMTLPAPRFYAPWAAFGFTPIAAASLQARADAHLERVLRGAR